MYLNNVSHLELNVHIDLEKLQFELAKLNALYDYMGYNTAYFGVKRKYKKAWSGISLWGSDGELHTDFTEGDYDGELKPTKLKSIMPYTYSIIEKIYGDSPKSRVRIMRIAPKSSLVWHSHVQEHGQMPTELTIQLPIELPKGFQYSVVNTGEFRWWKRFYKPNWFKSAETFELQEGKAYYFNSYHYHNVFNPSNEYRTTIMFYVDYTHPDIKKLVDNSFIFKNIL